MIVFLFFGLDFHVRLVLLGPSNPQTLSCPVMNSRFWSQITAQLGMQGGGKNGTNGTNGTQFNRFTLIGPAKFTAQSRPTQGRSDAT
jgi:hypothetical protein